MTQINGATLPLGVISQAVGVSAEGTLVREPDVNGDGKVDDLVRATKSVSGGLRLLGPDGDGVRADRYTGRRGVKLFDFSGSANWTSMYGAVTVSADAALTQYSAASLRCVVGASAYDGVKKAFGTNVFHVETGAVLRLTVYIPASAFTTVPIISLQFSDDADPSTNYVRFIFNSAVRPGWNVLVVKAGEDGTTDQYGVSWAYGGSFTSGNAWAKDFNFAQVILQNLAGQTVHLDSLVVGAIERPRIVFTLDGVGRHVLDAFAPALRSCGWRAGLSTEGGGGFVGQLLADIRTAVDTYGWTLGCMGLTHTSYNSNGRNIGADYDSATAEMVAVGLPKALWWAYPQNQSSPANDVVLAGRGVVWRRGFGLDTCYTAGGFIPNKIDGMIRQGFVHHLGKNYNTGTSAAQVKTRIDELCKTGGTLSLYTHSFSEKSSDWSLGGDLSQMYMLVDHLWSMHVQHGLDLVVPEEVSELQTTI